MSAVFKKRSTVVVEEDNDVNSSNSSDEENESPDEENQDSNTDHEISGSGDDSLGNSDEENSEDEKQVHNDANPGWADCMAKILKTKKADNAPVVLSKAKKIEHVKKKLVEKASFEVVQTEEDRLKLEDLESKLGKDKEEPATKKRKESFPHLRVKPNVLEKNHERMLSKIATKGVVQLFNAVRTHQKDLEAKMDEAGPTERKKDKVLKSVKKSKFLDMLDDQGKKIAPLKTEVKDEVKKEEKSSWSVFRDDLTTDAKMKDWDKKEDSNDEDKMSDFDDSDE